jgi:hypothetical protein
MTENKEVRQSENKEVHQHAQQCLNDLLEMIAPERHIERFAAKVL